MQPAPASSAGLEPLRLPSWLLPLAGVLLAGGLVAWLAGLGVDAPRAWRALLWAFLFWAGLAQGLLTWAALFRTAAARWANALVRLGQASIGFVLVAPLLMVLLYFGRQHLLPWLGEDLGDRGLWLNVPFLYARNIVALLVMALVSLHYVRRNLKVDTQVLAEPGHRLPKPQLKLTRAAIAVLVTYVLSHSLLALDWIMALDGHWYSALMPAHYFVGNLFVAMAVLILMTLGLTRPELEVHLGRRQWLDLANLMLGFELITIWFFYSQALTIWYANIPHETHWVLQRVDEPAWRPYTAVVVTVSYLGAFPFLIWREVKQHRGALALVALLVIAGMAVERYVLVAPTLAPHGAPLGWLEVLVWLGLGGGLLLAQVLFLRRYPLVSAAELRRVPAKEEA